jgi:hypothetical protein
MPSVCLVVAGLLLWAGAVDPAAPANGKKPAPAGSGIAPERSRAAKPASPDGNAPANPTSAGDPTAVAASPEPTPDRICADEKRRLADAEARYLIRHPAVGTARLRVAAACQPAPTGDCASARADAAESRERYMERHPKLVVAQVRAEALCAPAPSTACARARADLAVARLKYLDKHPLAVEARKAEARACAPNTTGIRASR